MVFTVSTMGIQAITSHANPTSQNCIHDLVSFGNLQDLYMLPRVAPELERGCGLDMG